MKSRRESPIVQGRWFSCGVLGRDGVIPGYERNGRPELEETVSRFQEGPQRAGAAAAHVLAEAAKDCLALFAPPAVSAETGLHHLQVLDDPHLALIIGQGAELPFAQPGY